MKNLTMAVFLTFLIIPAVSIAQSDQPGNSYERTRNVDLPGIEAEGASSETLTNSASGNSYERPRNIDADK